MSGARPTLPDADRSLPVPHAAETLHLLMRLRARGVNDTAVLRAFEAVPREFFAAPAHRDLARRDVALPLGCGQIVGAPSDLALALAALDLRKEHRALDIGTGSGYAAAVIGHLAGAVTSVERFRTLAIEAKRRLESSGLENVAVLQGDALAEVPGEGQFERAFIDFAVADPRRPWHAGLRKGRSASLQGRPHPCATSCGRNGFREAGGARSSSA